MQVVNVLLTNRWAAFTDKQYPYQDLVPYFRFRVPGYRFMPLYRMGHWDGYVKLIRRNKVPAGLFRTLRRKIEKELRIEFDVERAVHVPELHPESSWEKSDRPYQNECLEAMMKATKRGGGLILSATGTGKTRLTGLYFKRLVGTAVFLVDELTLLDQAKSELSKVMGEPIGEVGDQKFLPKRITVATVQTMHRHRKDPHFALWTKNLSVIVIDEIHTAMNRRNFQTVEEIQPPVVFGLTATLELKKQHVRSKACSLAGPVIYEYPLDRGVEERFLAQGIIVQVEVSQEQEKDDEGAYVKGTISDDYPAYISESAFRNKVVVELVKTAYDDKKFTVVLVHRIKHLKRLYKMLDGIPRRMVFGDKTREERILAKEKFQAGKIRLIITNQVFKKGIDIPRIDCIVEASGLKNKNDALQKYGRGVRMYKGKAGLLYFDVADVDNRFDKNARWRRSAYKSRKIPLRRYPVYDLKDVRKAYDVGVKMLARQLRRRNT